jgi:ribonucleoside-diphosphate reductase beta chain
MSVIQLKQQSVGYKPFRYPWAYQFWKAQQQVHWLPEEVPLSEDVRDWATRLSDNERELLTQIFRFFTQSDIDVNDNYMEKYTQVFKPTEIRMMLSAFSNMETIHVDAYSLLVETVGMPDAEYKAFMDYQAMRDKHDFLGQFNVDSDRDILKTMAVFGAFTEGLQLFASFAMLLNFPRFGKMKGMGQIVTWSVRDETLHCEGIIKLFHEFAAETGALDEELKQEIRQIAQHVVELEDKFIDLAFGVGGIEGMTPEDIKAYIRYVCDWRLSQLKLEPVFGIDVHPLPWLKSLLNGIEHANFFETRSTEYSKGATSSTWEDTWNHFDSVVVK